MPIEVYSDLMGDNELYAQVLPGEFKPVFNLDVGSAEKNVKLAVEVAEDDTHGNVYKVPRSFVSADELPAEGAIYLGSVFPDDPFKYSIELDWRGSSIEVTFIHTEVASSQFTVSEEMGLWYHKALRDIAASEFADLYRDFGGELPDVSLDKNSD